MASGSGIFIAVSRVPNTSETACVLKHIWCLITVTGIVPIKSTPVMSTSYLKVINVPMIPAEPKLARNSPSPSSTPSASCGPRPTVTLASLGLTFAILSQALRPAPTLARRSSLAVGTVKSAAQLHSLALPCALGA
ncbi:hypothetical protein AGABI1DRAFT_134302 [Agaricus bisporus var. burnettii JB137-S8]|uniref:Uncharacterized protein n=1 Tax=Agaricus bisporus var. burnettii (strain JB137-S8 / ATCC MYA-4627 / FGSC 10392) TaxID=597362 RepID=K5WEK6_AGABU|nr:uncharacterized protein AGABI1DRAFT_134302 [Agaricus bisporus var. burnettii JB137-S8]EKM73671.1 hypothetical protein AGABI1DRAFT_134302 [Agaricus bisporus var. burnettii JB137-S8]